MLRFCGTETAISAFVDAEHHRDADRIGADHDRACFHDPQAGSMSSRSTKRFVSGIAVVLVASCLPPTAQAQDFFSQLFGGLGARLRAPSQIMSPFGNEAPPPSQAPRARAGYGGGQAWCVRTCDGRYFPVAGPDNQSRAASCNSFCPASETKLIYGSEIDNAATETGRPYSELPNAFRYRKEIVTGCTCNGKDPVGLAAISVENDPTLRKGDIVAGPNGLVVAGHGADKRASMNFSPASESVQARYRRVPVVAAE